jgi:DNA-binding HxlR family transcriptional regulator
MKRKSLATSQCPVARSMELVGDWWTILIMRDAIQGLTRFDELERSLGIAPNILAGRLKLLVAEQMLERSCYSQRPARYEYVLTERGRDFRPVIQALVGWGNRHLAPEGPSVLITNTRTGEAADPVLVDRATGIPLDDPVFQISAGPAAGDVVRWRIAAAAARSAARIDAAATAS